MSTLEDGGAEPNVRELMDKSRNGLDQQELTLLLAYVTETRAPMSFKDEIVKLHLVPGSGYTLDLPTLLRILSAIGSPGVYYRNGNQRQHNRLLGPVQEQLLRWLVAALPLFGTQIYAMLDAVMPLLIGLLAYEYVRPHIAVLVMVAFSRLPKLALKQWHVKRTAELCVKFPYDKALSKLAHFFSSSFSIARQLGPLTRSSTFHYKKSETILNALNIKRHDAFEGQRNRVEAALDALTEKPSKVKRRKITRTHDAVLEASLPTRARVGAVGSVHELISRFEHISVTNPGALFMAHADDLNYRKMHLTLGQLLSEQFTRRVAYTFQFHVLPSEAMTKNAASFARWGGLPSMAPLRSYLEESSETLVPILELTRHLNPDSPAVFEKLVQLVGGLSPQKAAQAFVPLSLGLRSAEATPLFFALATKLLPHLDLSAKLALCAVFRRLSDCVMPPVTLVHLLVASTHPLLVSEALGYIHHLKQFKMEGADVQLRNSLVMDTLNFLWRDMAFEHLEHTVNRGMYLHPDYVSRLGGLNAFAYSQFTTLREVGGLIRHPAFSYICAELVWMLEDAANVNTRHPGPISEQSVQLLRQDEGVEWVPLLYGEIRVEMLNRLDDMGFKGLCDLLFSLLKTLQKQRKLDR